MSRSVWTKRSCMVLMSLVKKPMGVVLSTGFVCLPSERKIPGRETGSALRQPSVRTGNESIVTDRHRHRLETLRALKSGCYWRALAVVASQQQDALIDLVVIDVGARHPQFRPEGWALVSAGAKHAQRTWSLARAFRCP